MSDERIGIRELITQAEAEIETLTPAEARALHGRDEVVFVDVRDVRELTRDGTIPGAFHAPRGMLEFWIDPESPYHKPVFAESKRFVLYCASGWRSALATQIARRMGLTSACHIGGGYTAWKAAGGATERVERR